MRLAPAVLPRLRQVGLDSLGALSSRQLGEVVTDHRTSWVRRTVVDTTHIFIKTYDYPSAGDRARGWLRTTWLAPSRAAREWDALTWLRDRGFAAPPPWGAIEWRRLGVLRRAVVVTEADLGEPLARRLPAMPPDEREAVLAALVRFVEELHRAGFRDRNLDLRNLLAHRLPGGDYAIAKIDSPRYRLRPPGPAHDRLAREDWARLARSLAEVGVDGGTAERMSG